MLFSRAAFTTPLAFAFAARCAAPPAVAFKPRLALAVLLPALRAVALAATGLRTRSVAALAPMRPRSRTQRTVSPRPRGRPAIVGGAVTGMEAGGEALRF